MKRTLIVLCTLIFALSLFGARLMNKSVTVTQPDGTTLSILASGDEFHNWLHDANNFTIIQDGNTGWYTYAVRSGDTVIASQYIAGQSNPLAIGLEAGVNLSPERIRDNYNRLNRNDSNLRINRAPHFGTINNLVVFIKFANSPDFTQEIPFYSDMFNTDTPGYNSMHNYFQATSYNQLNIETCFYPVPNDTIVVCYVDNQPRGYYMPLSGANPIGYDENTDESTTREFALLTNASNFVSSQIPSTLDLDGDDDGNIDNVCFIVQGSTTAWGTLLWPHRWAIFNSTSYINGARVYDFNFQLESFLDGSGNSVLCHEMAHTLGCPDLYRYYDTTIDPIGGWDLMCANNNPPQSMSAWMKYNYLDWVTTVPTITQSGTYSINSVWSQENNIFRIPSWKNNEYYLVEYRKPFGIYDTNLPGTGLLIYRLNTNENGNAGGPPDELYIYRPNGTSTTSGGYINMAYFSQQTGRTAINEATIPNGFMSNNMPGGLDISQISASGDETMSFHVNISDVQITYPKGGETIFSGTSKTITWKARAQTGNAKIEYSTNNGQQWQTIIATTSNNGSFLWSNIPVLDSDQCLIKVTALTSGANDVCNRTFSIASSIDVPVSIFPANQLTNAPTNPTLRWHAVPGADSYYIQISHDSDFNNNVVNLIDWTDSTFTYNDLMPFTTYYWHVAAYAPVGLSEFSPSCMFTTGEISILPALPPLVSPANNAENLPLDIVLNWNTASYAYFYHYEVALDYFFLDVVTLNDSINALQAVLPTLEPNTHYFWRVRGGNPAGYGFFTNIRNFTTGNYGTANQDDVSQMATNLETNYPNPFNLSTEIEFNLNDKHAPAKLSVFNIKGQTVKVLFDGVAKNQTNHFSWDGKDSQGTPVSSGIYYYKLETKDYSKIKKMLLLK